MIEYKFWIPRQKSKKTHQRRQRRACEGELIQIDASTGEISILAFYKKCFLHIKIRNRNLLETKS